jgi:hypothetical protein
MKTFLSLLLAGAAFAAPSFAEVDVHIGIPAPQIVIESPPRLVVVPGAPVQYAPDVSYNYFSYGGRYYTIRDDRWYVAPGYGGPWTYVERTRVPGPLLGVPVRYYREPRYYHEHHRGHPHGMPPGQAKKIYGKGYKHHHHHDDD